MNIYEEISRNNRRTILTVVLFLVAVIFIAFIALFIIQLGDVRAGTAWRNTLVLFPWVSVTVTVIVLLWTLISYRFGDKMILKFMHATPVERKTHFDLYNTVENLCITAGAPVPKIYMIDDNSLNAFATGRNPKHSVICFTTGLVERLGNRELEAVAAHELSHITNYDIRLQLIIVTVVGIVAMIGEIMLRARWVGGRDNKGGGIALAGLFVLFIGYPLLSLMKLSLSRNREYLADATGAYYTRDPLSLANALQKISQDPRVESADRMKAAAHLFIDDPSVEAGKQRARVSWFARILSTHPPVHDRITRLRNAA